ncbi:MAG: tetratricopeptide repeat protein [Lentisphaeria bacterium]|nr:tetratricopeptide repeat protein [Lentisphaeria bacterium]
MKEFNPLTRQLAPLIIFIVLIIVITLIIGGSRLPEDQKDLRDSSKLEMRLSPFSYQPPARTDSVKNTELRLPEPEAVLAAAARDISSAQYPRAEDQLRTALIFYPNDRRILNLLGTVLFMQKKYPEADGIFRLMTMMNPDDTVAYTNLSAVLASQKRYQEAIVNARKVYLKEPDSPIAALNLSSMYSLNGDTSEALEYFRKAYEKLGENILPLSYNSNFDNIRKEKLFQNIVREIREKRKSVSE